jgi:hypothetical protein
MNFRSKDEWRNWYYSAKAQGICTNCGREKAAKGRVRCLSCLDMNAAYQMNRRARIRREEQNEANI